MSWEMGSLRLWARSWPWLSPAHLEKVVGLEGTVKLFIGMRKKDSID